MRFNFSLCPTWTARRRAILRSLELKSKTLWWFQMFKYNTFWDTKFLNSFFQVLLMSEAAPEGARIVLSLSRQLPFILIYFFDDAHKPLHLKRIL